MVSFAGMFPQMGGGMPYGRVPAGYVGGQQPSGVPTGLAAMFGGQQWREPGAMGQGAQNGQQNPWNPSFIQNPFANMNPTLSGYYNALVPEEARSYVYNPSGGLLQGLFGVLDPANYGANAPGVVGTFPGQGSTQTPETPAPAQMTNRDRFELMFGGLAAPRVGASMAGDYYNTIMNHPRHTQRRGIDMDAAYDPESDSWRQLRTAMMGRLRADAGNR